MSDIVQLVGGYPVHVYWGRKLRRDSNLDGLRDLAGPSGLDRLPQEYPQ